MVFRARKHSKNRRLLVGICLSLVVAFQPALAVPTLTPEQQKAVALVQQLIARAQQGQPKEMLAANALGIIPCLQSEQSIVGQNEQNELQINALVQAINKTETSFGSVALHQSMHPVANLEIIQERQRLVRALVEDENLFKQVEKELRVIKDSEHALLAYWDDAQYENPSKLFSRAQGLYYSKLATLFGQRVNDKRLPLKAASLCHMGSITFELMFYLGMQGILYELERGMEGKGSGKNGAISLHSAIVKGIQQPYMMFWPWETDLGKKYKENLNGEGDLIDYIFIGQTGSMGDIFSAIRVGCRNPSWELGIVGKRLKIIADNIGFSWLSNKIDNDGILTNKSQPGSSRLVAGLGTALFTYYRAMMLWEKMQGTYGRVKSFFNTGKELHVHTVYMANAFNAIERLTDTVSHHEIFSVSCISKHMKDTFKAPSQELKSLVDVLKKDTFELSNAQSQIYSRGNVLFAHRMFGKCKQEVIPLLQAVGELDALYSMARMMKDCQGGERQFSFAEFVSGTQATIELEQAWLPMVKQAVVNTISLGGAHNPNKIIITGPNGGGKSVFLKMLGCCIALAQSWGIVPAHTARISLFDGMRSCVHPQESIEHELSTFMAEKLRIDTIRQYVFQNSVKPGFKTVLLLDEPFKGTVDAESADRIYDFGKEIAPLNGLIACMATHVERPIKLAQETGVFANYHVCIKELDGGKFQREFRVEPGVLDWWFTDAHKRSRFIDFVTLEKYYEHQKK